MGLRKVLVTTVGHVDHGKSSILDSIRGSAIVETEAGRITQAIGASIIPIDKIKKICGKLLDNLKFQITIPGILAIDTPGHAAFTNIRKRGGALADIAILVVDINEGFMPQTEESLQILKNNKTPFIVAANKVDLIPGWKKESGFILNQINSQDENVKYDFETKMYTLVGKLNEMGFNSERFDRVEDYTKQIAIVPTSAITGQGMPELLMVLTGLAQKYLESCLKCDTESAAIGTVLEIKEVKGLGSVIDAIIYDGKIKRNDTILIAGIDKPIVTRVKIILEPEPLKETRDVKTKFTPVNEAIAATAIRISAADLAGVVSGMPFKVIRDQSKLEEEKEKIQEEIDQVLFESDNIGVLAKADTLGSIEALIYLLKEQNIPIRSAKIGDITKKDLIEAKGVSEKDPLMGVIIGFNVKEIEQDKAIKVIISNIVYDLINKLKDWQESEKKRLEQEKLKSLTRPCKIMLLTGYVFRQNNPAIVGVEVMAGILKTSVPLMNKSGDVLTNVNKMQKEQENVAELKKNEQAAIEMPGVTVGRQIKEGDILYSEITEDEFRRFKESKAFLSEDEKELLKEIAIIKRKKNLVWGV